MWITDDALDELLLLLDDVDDAFTELLLADELMATDEVIEEICADDVMDDWLLGAELLIGTAIMDEVTLLASLVLLRLDVTLLDAAMLETTASELLTDDVLGTGLAELPPPPQAARLVARAIQTPIRISCCDKFIIAAMIQDITQRI